MIEERDMSKAKRPTYRTVQNLRPLIDAPLSVCTTVEIDSFPSYSGDQPERLIISGLSAYQLILH